MLYMQGCNGELFNFSQHSCERMTLLQQCLKGLTRPILIMQTNLHRAGETKQNLSKSTMSKTFNTKNLR